MTTIIHDQEIADALIAERRAKGIDLWDEVWEGAYIVMPSADIEHQDLLDNLVSVLKPFVRDRRLGSAYSTVNISDRVVGWQENFRVPDLVVFLKGNKAENRGAFWHGGPDLAIEIVSAGDRSREKLDFYTKVGTREVLIVDRKPWTIEQYSLRDGELQLVTDSDPNGGSEISSEILGLTFRLLPGEPRPIIEIADSASDIVWRV